MISWCCIWHFVVSADEAREVGSCIRGWWRRTEKEAHSITWTDWATELQVRDFVSRRCYRLLSNRIHRPTSSLIAIKGPTWRWREFNLLYKSKESNIDYFIIYFFSQCYIVGLLVCQLFCQSTGYSTTNYIGERLLEIPVGQCQCQSWIYIAQSHKAVTALLNGNDEISSF